MGNRSDHRAAVDRLTRERAERLRQAREAEHAVRAMLHGYVDPPRRAKGESRKAFARAREEHAAYQSRFEREFSEGVTHLGLCVDRVMRTDALIDALGR